MEKEIYYGKLATVYSDGKMLSIYYNAQEKLPHEKYIFESEVKIPDTEENRIKYIEMAGPRARLTEEQVAENIEKQLDKGK